MKKPKEYKNIEGWFDYEDFYEAVARKLSPGSTFVELGVWKGRSICYFAEWCKILKKRMNVFGIDMFSNYSDPAGVKWHNDSIDTVRRNLRNFGVGPFVKLIQSDSYQAAKLFENESIDFLWIDTDHTYETICRELIAWYPKVKSGGYFCGHDLDPVLHPEIIHALKTIGIQYRLVSCRSWMFVKP